MGQYSVPQGIEGQAFKTDSWTDSDAMKTWLGLGKTPIVWDKEQMEG